METVKKPRIYWSNKEEDTVLKRAAELAIREGIDMSSTKRATLGWLIQKAQSILDASKHKELASILQYLTKPKVKDKLNWFSAASHVPQAPIEQKLSMTAKELELVVASAVERAMVDMNARLDLILEALHQQSPNNVLHPKDVRTQAKKIIVIVGLIGAQINEAKEYAPEFKVKVFEGKENTGKIVAACRSADYVINMTRFSHRATENAITMAGVKVIRVTGCMTDLKNTINELK